MSQFFGVSSSTLSSSKHPLRRNSAPSLEDSYFTNSTLTDNSTSSSSRLFSSVELPSTISPIPSPTTSAARTHEHRLNAAQEQRTYRDSCQRLMSHIQGVMGVCQDLKQTQFPIIYPFANRKPIRSHTLDTIETVRLAASNRFANHDLSILSLDLKLGHTSTDLSSLESKSITTLFQERLDQSLKHLNHLHDRVKDTASKVLVTGDLNSGKSTFVNALLKRELLPADQQPCTNLFCEVLDAVLMNDGLEQIHAIPTNVETYNRLDPTTYHLIEWRHLYKIITEDYEHYKMLKVYANDARTTQESLLHNGVVDIALIDSPGLNTDSVKTTAVFARQEEIDVVVFVVSAENHFTLSGKEFLWNAANEKTHIFIVVNRFDSIRDKDRCRRLILEQIRQLSPATYADADDLVHFVSAGSVDLEPGSRQIDRPDFARLEQRLRAFVLENRTKSKLMPAKNYLVNVLMDVHALAESSHDHAEREAAETARQLQDDLPAYQHLLKVRDRLLTEVERVAEKTVTAVQKQVTASLQNVVEDIRDSVTIEYPGILLIWQYAQDLADSMSQTLVKQVRTEEEATKRASSVCLEQLHTMGSEHLGEYEMKADVSQISASNRKVEVPVEWTDFFDWVVDDKVSGVALSVGAAAMVGGRMLGFRDAMTSIWTISSMMPTHKRWVAPVMSVATLGLVVYVVSDMRHAVERKLVKKFKVAVRETGYVDHQARRLGREARKVLRVEGWEIQNGIQRAIERKEEERHSMEVKSLTSKEMAAYFASVLAKSDSLLEKVEMVPTDNNA
ncbi:MAG: hypothetical protein EXX96DRAFT_533020 [Benjaminiella poitrasii]|nr:MAG: hypothetical protein EXX96DRAFT_533020 [Benjaminiella poitrasii]